MNLSTRIAELADQGDVRVAFCFDTEHVKKINAALECVAGQARLNLVKELYTLWCDGGAALHGRSGLEEQKKEAEATFGEVFTEYGTERKMTTVTADGKQLRVWFGIPGHMVSTHVDSCGRNLLLEVVGQPTTVAQYLALFTDSEPIQVPNGIRLYMWWE